MTKILEIFQQKPPKLTIFKFKAYKFDEKPYWNIPPKTEILHTPDTPDCTHHMTG